VTKVTTITTRTGWYRQLQMACYCSYAFWWGCGL